MDDPEMVHVRALVAIEREVLGYPNGARELFFPADDATERALRG